MAGDSAVPVNPFTWFISSPTLAQWLFQFINVVKLLKASHSQEAILISLKMSKLRLKGHDCFNFLPDTYLSIILPSYRKGKPYLLTKKWFYSLLKTNLSTYPCWYSHSASFGISLNENITTTNLSWLRVNVQPSSWQPISSFHFISKPHIHHEPLFIPL